MKVNVLPVVAGFAGSLILSAAASAEFTGFKLENKTAALGGIEAGFMVFELYANFDNALDTVVNVFGGEITANHNFYQPDEGSLPSKKTFYDTNGPWDSFVTIGFLFGGGTGNPDGPDAGTTGDSNATTLDPSFFEDNFLFGSSIDDPEGDPTKGAGWFNSNPTANNIQGQAGTYADLKVLLARFTFAIDAGDPQFTASVTGKLSLTYKPNNVGSAQVFDQAFELTRIVPAPGAIALLGLAGLAGSRRRSA
jgi:hypothetical protein